MGTPLWLAWKSDPKYKGRKAGFLPLMAECVCSTHAACTAKGEEEIEENEYLKKQCDEKEAEKKAGTYKVKRTEIMPKEKIARCNSCRRCKNTGKCSVSGLWTDMDSKSDCYKKYCCSDLSIHG